MPSLVSVIIPVYNGERFVDEAIDSVLAQEYCPVEVIVIDDGSSDGTGRVCARYGAQIRYYVQTNQGAAAARNAGVARARGDYIGFLDADDRWAPKKLTMQMRAFAADPALDVVFCHIRQVTLDGAETVVVESADGAHNYRYQVEVVPGIHVDALLLRRAAWMQVGKFDPDKRIGDLIEWYGRALDLGLHMQMLPDVLVARRIHGQNLGIQHHAEARAAYLRTLREMVARRRLETGSP
ncbi:MAG: glycosyltransferase [Anaerolineales bacterium]|nr:glycosyltransferase [Anaerolineales bacterium]